MIPTVRTTSIASDVTLEIVSDHRDFNSLRQVWNRVVDSMGVPSPFLTWEWNNAWWSVFGGRREMQVVVVREGGEVIGIMPLYRRRYGPVRALVPFGWPDRITEQMEPIASTSRRPRVVWALSEWLMTQHAVGLVPGVDASVAALFGEQVLRDEVYYDWRRLPAKWDELMNGLHRSMRGNIRYYPRLLQRSGHKLDFRVEESVEGVKSALPILYRLHSARAKANTGERHRDRLNPDSRREFLGRLADVLPAYGEMKIGVLQVDGSDVAAQLWFERGGTMFLHYSGFEPDWSKFSVAMIVTAEIMRGGVERGVRRVEFLRGSKQFKTRWNTEQRVQADVYYVWNPWLLPLLHRLRDVRRTLRNRRYRRTVSPTAEPVAE